MPKNKKGKRVGIVGAGNVGSTVAYSLAVQGACHEVILRDNKVEIAKGKALDMSQAAQSIRSHTVVSVAETMADLKDCDVVVVTAGSPRLPGMSRDDLLLTNAKIMKEVAQGIKEYSSEAIVLVVSNPLDAMVYVAIKETGFPPHRVLGMAGVLDSARMAHFIHEELGYGAGQIRASVMGGHGDDMVPLPRYSTVAGVPLADLMSQEKIDEIVERTRKGGAEIVSLLKNGSAYYAPGKATSIMVDAILRDTKQIHPTAVMLNGEFGYSDVVSGVPAMLGANGVEKIIEVSLNDAYYPEIVIETDGLDDKEAFVASKIKDAKDLIDALEMRKATLYKIGLMIIEYQYDFFFGGSIKPMKLKDLADDLGRNPSTISRAISGKYLSCSRGVIPLKQFFATAVEEDISNSAIKEYMCEIIKHEDRKKPLSDVKILKMIEDKFGVKMVRRTITKYRKEFNIAGSSERKKLYALKN